MSKPKEPKPVSEFTEEQKEYNDIEQKYKRKLQPFFGKELVPGSPEHKKYKVIELERGADLKKFHKKYYMPDVSKAVKNTDGEPENSTLQLFVDIFPVYPFRQEQKDARYPIFVFRRNVDEYKRLFKKMLTEKMRLTKKEHKALKRLDRTVAYRNPPTKEELRLIAQTVRSYDMDEIGVFLVKRFPFLTRAGLNRLTWDCILENLQRFLLRRMKELQADLASKQKKEAEQPTEASGKAEDKKNEKALTGEVLALVMLVEHPDWPDTKIAKAVGVSRTTLYDWSNFKKAKEILKQGKNHLPKGSKDGKTGNIEAWETDTLADT